jgi:hypothetical protein
MMVKIWMTFTIVLEKQTAELVLSDRLVLDKT